MQLYSVFWPMELSYIISCSFFLFIFLSYSVVLFSLPPSTPLPLLLLDHPKDIRKTVKRVSEHFIAFQSIFETLHHFPYALLMIAISLGLSVHSCSTPAWPASLLQAVRILYKKNVDCFFFKFGLQFALQLPDALDATSCPPLTSA